MRKTIQTISKNWKIFPKAILIAFILRIIVELIATINPLVTKAIVDTIQKGESYKQDFYFLIIIFFVATIIDQVLTKISGIYRSIFKEHFFLEKNKQSFVKIFSLDYQQYIDQGTGQLLKKVERGIESEWNIFEGIFQIYSVAVIRFTTSLFVIFYSLPFAAAILVVGILLLLRLAKNAQKKSEPLYQEVKDIRENASRQESKMIMEKQLINLSNKEYNEMNIYEKMLIPLQQKSWKADFRGGLPYDLMFVLFRIVEGVGYLFIGWQIWNNAATYGDVIMLIGFIWQLRWPFDIIAGAISDWSRQKARYESLKDILAMSSTIINGNVLYNADNGTIVYDNVVFGYEHEKQVIKKLSLTIPGGTTCAFVGHSGSGKSTLVKLLLRYYDVNSGSITIDNQYLPSLDRKSLYVKVGYLAQEPSIFDGTIRENLLYAIDDDQSVSDEQLWQALDNAQITNRIRGLGKGLDTEIGERGIKLSGGERQRLAIARIFLKNPKILILDEPTSALDSISEHAITGVMKNLFVGRTVIIIAHRLQTVMHADNIIVLDKGSIVQQGTHEELLQQEGVYKTLVNLQKGTIEE